MDYIQKPFTEDELLAFVKKALIKRQDRIQRQLKPQVNISHLPESHRVRTGEFSIPGGVLISQGHCWATLAQDGSVKVGIDDFAKKLIGPVDAVSLPNVGMTVKAGQPLFSIRQKNRTIQLHAPLSGRVTKVNQQLAENCEALDMTPYGKNWVCVIEGDNLDVEVAKLKIGKSAVSLFQEDIDRFRELMKGMLESGADGGSDETVYAGEMQRLDDAQWEIIAREFFRR